MSTSTVIERMPESWDSGDSMGEWDEGQEAAGKAWRRAFKQYLSDNYPHCYLVGDEIHGPASYRFNGLSMQSDTPELSDLTPMPEDGIYNEFQNIHQDDWSDVIEEYII